ncbi:glutaredoxin family protein [Hahella sp. SMD15-11]|uniref:Glutaredoxin family protein n=1 Tax=Thermohahella caldifontis TaxID=3142973 RepID=A0AB39UZ82_9GAMM
MTGTLTLFLLGTQGCHLCEQAGDVVREVAEHFTRHGVPVQLVGVDIADHDDWVATYGTRIPVLCSRWPSPSGTQELGWPFDQADVYHFLQQYLASETS